MNLNKTQQRIRWVGLEAFNMFSKPAARILASFLVIRLVSVDLWGSIVPYLIGLEMALIVVNWGNKLFLIRSFSLSPSTIEFQWLESLLARSILALVVAGVVFTLPITEEIQEPFLAWVLASFVVTSFDSLIQFKRRYWESLVIEWLGIALLCWGIWLFKDGLTISDFIWCSLWQSLLKLVLLSAVFFRTLIKGFAGQRWSSILSFFKRSFPFFLLTVTGLLVSKLDLYIVTWSLPEAEVARYQVLIGFLIAFLTFSYLLLAPFQKNIYRMNDTSLRSLKRKYISLGFVISLLAGMVISGVFYVLYELPLSFAEILLAVVYLMPIYFYLIESIGLTKHEATYQLSGVTLIAALVNGLLCVVLVPIWGIAGALICSILSRMILAGLVVRGYRKLVD